MKTKLLLNPGKFQAIIIDKRKQDHAYEIFKICSKEIKVTSQVKFLGVEINNKLIRLSLLRLKWVLVFQERKVLVISFVLSNFNYCSLVWMFASLLELGTYIKQHWDSCLAITQVATMQRILEKSGKIPIKRATRNFSGQERFCEIRALRSTFYEKVKKKRSAGKNFGVFSLRYS